MKYRDLDRQEKRSCRHEKHEWVNQKGTEAQEAANRNETRTLYRIIRELTCSPSGSGTLIKDRGGRALPTQEQRDSRWVEHFNVVLIQPMPTTAFDPSILNPIPDLPVNLDTITAEETKIKSGDSRMARL